MRIKIYCIGKIKESYLKEGINEYLKRLLPYAKVEIIEVSDEPIKENPNKFDIESAKDKEGKKILKLIKNTDYLKSWNAVFNGEIEPLEKATNIQQLIDWISAI